MHVIRVLIHCFITLALASAGLLFLSIGISMITSTYKAELGLRANEVWYQAALGTPLWLIAGGLVLLGFAHLLSLIWRRTQMPKPVNATTGEPWNRLEPSI